MNFAYILAIFGYIVIGFFYPSQLASIYRTKNVEGISPLAMWLLLTGNILVGWSTIYGLPITLVYFVGSVVFGIFTALILVGYYKFRKPRKS